MEVKKIIIISCFFLGFGTGVWAEARPGYLGIYGRSLNFYDQSLNDSWNRRSALSSGYNVAEAEHIIKTGEISKLHLSNPSSEQISNEYTKLKKFYEEEKQFAKAETDFLTENSITGIFSNGRLDDSPFDLISDLNIVDIILFGENANIPVADWAQYFDRNHPQRMNSSWIEGELSNLDYPTNNNITDDFTESELPEEYDPLLDAPNRTPQNTTIDLQELARQSASTYTESCPPTPPAGYGQLTCDATCTTDSQCQTPYGCYNGHCRNTDCASKNTCNCTTPLAACNAVCDENNDCQSGYCYEHQCRTLNCPTISDCTCPTNTNPFFACSQGNICQAFSTEADCEAAINQDAYSNNQCYATENDCNQNKDQDCPPTSDTDSSTTTKVTVPNHPHRYCNGIFCVKVTIKTSSQRLLMSSADNSILAHSLAINKALTPLNNQVLLLRSQNKMALGSPFTLSVDFGKHLRGMRIIFTQKSMYDVEQVRLKEKEKKENQLYDLGQKQAETTNKIIQESDLPPEGNTKDPGGSAKPLTALATFPLAESEIIRLQSQMEANNQYFTDLNKNIMVMLNIFKGLADNFMDAEDGILQSFTVLLTKKPSL